MFENFNNAALIVLIVVGVLYVLVWIGITIWTSRDIRRRTDNVAIQFSAIVFVLVFSLIGLLLYLIFRPMQTAEQLESKKIEERIIRSIDDIGTCYKCDMDIASNYVYCPHCRTKLHNVCSGCDGLLESDWAVCAYCGTEAPKKKRGKDKKAKRS